MKRFFCHLIMAFLLTNHVQAENVVERQASLDQCVFILSDPFNGRVSVDTESAPHSASYIAMINTEAKRPFETMIRFDCHSNVSTGDLSDLAGISKKDGKWEIDFDGNAGAVISAAWKRMGRREYHPRSNGRGRE
ncbi:hypothetical protein [Paraburkholderia ultramafica]|uniref:hypothetical protein n=1 Tax=Paraburkholderia ultramafica TaxID=1544867 RepID=UPI001581FCB4|nr:hypothetical protein [Paraburkholderia ultramafica]